MQVPISQPPAVGGKTVVADHWQWTETIFGIIPMEENDFYVDSTSTPPVPFFTRQQITPFGGAKIGVRMCICTVRVPYVCARVTPFGGAVISEENASFIHTSTYVCTCA